MEQRWVSSLKLLVKSVLKNISSSIIAIVIWPFALIAFAIAASTYLIAAFFISPKRLHPLARFLCRAMLLSGGQIIKVEGEIPNPKGGPYLYLFNHQSMLDQFLIASVVKEYISAVGGDFQFSWPIWGRLIKRYGAIPIVRENIKKAIYSLNLAEDELRKGTSFLISPEGTRTLNGKMGAFKKGPFHLSLNTGTTIIPIGIIGAFDSKQKNDWRIYPGVVTVKFGEPVKKDFFMNMSVEELRDDIRERISALCQDDLVAV